MLSDRVHGLLAGEEATSARQASNFTTHLAALTATKTADGLIDPKIVLAWLTTALGAPAYITAALVPVRESGALLPQLALARLVQRRRRRKVVWAVGSLGQGLAALGIAASALMLDGAAAGWAILACLALLAVSRAACSASHKDVLARTLSKGTRGTVSGSAGTAGAIAVFAFAVLLGLGVIPREVPWIAGFIGLAGVLWIAAALIFLRLDEPGADTTDNDAGGVTALAAPLREDAELRRYLAVRLLLISTALAPPFLVMLSAQGGFGNLGLLLIGSAAAAILSSYVWGRLSDRSSRRTLMAAGTLAALVLAAAGLTGLATGGLGGAFGAMAFVFAAQIAYEGARAGRKTHLTDMDTGDRKAVYTALSNSIVGLMLLAGGAFGVLAELAGPAWVLVAFAAMAAAGAAAALGLDEVQSD